jgi:hypothetical protein
VGPTGDIDSSIRMLTGSPKTAPCRSEKGLGIDGSFPRPVARRRLAGPGPLSVADDPCRRKKGGAQSLVGSEAYYGFPSAISRRSAASARRAGPETPHPRSRPSALRTTGPRRRSLSLSRGNRGPGHRSRPLACSMGSRSTHRHQIGIEPCAHLIGRTARAFRRDCDPDPHGAPSGGSRLGGYCGIRRSTPFGRYHVVNQSREEAR